MSFNSYGRRSYRPQRRHYAWGAVIAVIVCILAIGSCTYVKYIKEGTATFTVTRLDDQAQGHGHKYLIGTTAGVFQDTDNIFHLKYNSSDLYFALKVGHRYRCQYTGFRVPVFSSYKNLIHCTEVGA